jgi:uncharacterized phage protein gp47/JayE
MKPDCSCEPCGCCAGLEVVTPQAIANRPGLAAIAYRAGTYATFLESMLARLSTLYLDVPVPDDAGKLERVFPLAGLVLKSGTLQRMSSGLSTRDPSDPAIALLDAWAVVADVLTFYEERIATEGYLRTATERLSVLELARLVGYRLRPGISSSVYLAFNVNAGFNGIVPSGTRAQSLPTSGQKPQPFETSDDLPARDVWNNLKPRLTRPQVITLVGDPDGGQIPIDRGTDASTRGTLYFDGTSTNLKVGDALLIVAGDGPGEQVLRFVESVRVQEKQSGTDPQDKVSRTEVTLQMPLPSLSGSGAPAVHAVDALHAALDSFIDDASSLFSGGEQAAEVADILTKILADATALAQAVPVTATASDVASVLLPAIPELQDHHDIAVRRGFTRLEPWIADVIVVCRSLLEQLPTLDDAEGPQIVRAPITGAAEFGLPSIGHLVGILDKLALAPSMQPANSFRLTRQVRQVFTPASDIAPRLLAAFKPAAAKTLYKAWGNIQTPPTEIKVYAMRVKAAPFGTTAPLKPVITGGTLQPSVEWDISTTDTDGTLLHLDAVFDKITPESWVVVHRTDSGAPASGFQFVKLTKADQISRADYGMAAKITRLTLEESWQNSFPAGAKLDVFRGTTAYAQPEELPLAEEPLDRDVDGNTIELGALYDGLESGRWIIVSGQRTDIADASGGISSTGVTGNELVMISAVTQGSGKESCRPLTVDVVPFARVYYVVESKDSGDRLIVAEPNVGFLDFLKTIHPPDDPAGTQQICNPVQLAPGLYCDAYVPTTDERSGNFGHFGTLPDPANRTSVFKDGVIPPARADASDPHNPAPVFAWRIAGITSGSETLHTHLVLANTLAYTYDTATVTVYGNVTHATHGQTQGEVLGDGNAGEPLQQFPLHQAPLTYLPAATPEGASSTLVVRVNEIEWHDADNLFVLGPTDREFTTQTDDSGTTTVVFGNGLHGLRVPTGSGNVKAVYRSGTGKAGNVDAEQISQLATQPLGVKSVINPLAAAGGAEGDTRDQARRNVPIGITALDRLVSVQDYADFARRFAGIGKASARRLTDGRRLLVHLTIAGKDDIPIDPTTDLYHALVLALADAGDASQPVQISLRRLKLLVIAAGVKVKPDYAWEVVAAAVRTALLDRYSFDGRDLGQNAFLSEAVSTIQATPGVLYVDMRTFDAVAESVTAAQLATLATTLMLNSVVPAELAYLDPAATDPARRIAPAELVILSPDIPDTLILTEITT